MDRETRMNDDNRDQEIRPFSFNRNRTTNHQNGHQQDQTEPTTRTDTTQEKHRDQPEHALPFAHRRTPVHHENNVHTGTPAHTVDTSTHEHTVHNAHTVDNVHTVDTSTPVHMDTPVHTVHDAYTVSTVDTSTPVHNAPTVDSAGTVDTVHDASMGARKRLSRPSMHRGKRQYEDESVYDEAMSDTEVIDHSDDYSSFLDMTDEDDMLTDAGNADNTDYSGFFPMDEPASDSDDDVDDDHWFTPRQTDVNNADTARNDDNAGTADTGDHVDNARNAHRGTSVNSTLTRQARADAVRKGVKQSITGAMVQKKVTKPAPSAGTTPEQDLFLIKKQVQKNKRIPWNKRDMNVIDYITRWQFGTTSMLAQAGGFHDSNMNRLHDRFKNYEDLGLIRSNEVFAGPVLWYILNTGANLSTRPWLNGTTAYKINPSTMSHYLGLSSIASQLYSLSPKNMTADILHLDDYDGMGAWLELATEFETGESWLISEKEYRSAWSRLRIAKKGLIDETYRKEQSRELLEWYGPNEGMTLKAELARGNDDYLLNSPELVACYPDDEGEHMYKWVVWGNYIWNTNINGGQGGLFDIDTGMADDGNVYLRDRDEYDKPILDYANGDKFMTEDHCPDIVIARKRDRDGSARSIAIELELTAKPVEHYMKILSGYLSDAGQDLYRNVIWLVGRKSTRNALLRAMCKLHNEDLEDIVRIIPFWTEERRNSFWSGADIIRGRWLDEKNSNRIVRDDGNENLNEIIDLRGRGRTDIRPARQYINKSRKL